MTKERSKGIVGIFILITVLFFVFLAFAFITISNLRNTSDLSDRAMRDSDNGPIAVIPLEGAIMDSKKFIQMLHAAEEESSVKAILVRVDSPGGAVAPTQEIYEEIVRVNKDKPVYSSFGSVAASGGYYVGAATRKIFANPGTLTGSIGVIMQFANLSKLFEMVKVKPEVIKAGRYKDIGSPSREMTEEERQLLTASLQETHQQFIDDIVRTRESRLLSKPSEFAQGQVFNGKQALKMGLVDELCGMWEAGRRIHKELKLKEKFGLRFVKPKKKRFSLTDLLEESEETMSTIKGFFSESSYPAYRLNF